MSDRYCPDKLYLKEWSYLNDLEFPRVPVDLKDVSHQVPPSDHMMTIHLSRKADSPGIADWAPQLSITKLSSARKYVISYL